MLHSGSKSFTLKTGICHLYPDRIEVQRTDLWGKLGQFFYQRGIHVVFPFYLLLSIAFAFLALFSYLISNAFLALFFAISALVALYALWANRKISFAPLLPRKEIESVQYLPAVPGQSRARFLIHYRPRKRLLTRILSMPTATHQGTTIADTAFWMMREEGFISPENQ